MNQTISQESSSYYLSLTYSSFDCYDLIKLFYKKEFNLELLSQDYVSPSLLNKESVMNQHESYLSLVKAEQDHLREVDSPQYGDIILFKAFGIPVHVGIYIDKKFFLHTQKKTGPCFEKISAWEKRIIGYYRHVDKT